VITSEPEIMREVLGPDDQFLVIASDGIFDSFTNQQVIDFILKSKFSFRVAEDICREAQAGSFDNISCIVIWLGMHISFDHLVMVHLEMIISICLDWGVDRSSEVESPKVEMQRGSQRSMKDRSNRHSKSVIPSLFSLPSRLDSLGSDISCLLKSQMTSPEDNMSPESLAVRAKRREYGSSAKRSRSSSSNATAVFGMAPFTL